MRRKTARPSYSLLLFIVFLLAVSGVFFVFRFYHAYRDRTWNGSEEYIVFNTASLEIKIFTPHKERVRTYVLPKNAYVEVPEGYGYYRLKDVRELSRVEGRGEGLAVEAVSNTFGIPFDASMGTLTEWDRLLIWYSGWAYEEKDERVDLDKAPIFEYETRIDGVEMQKVDPAKVDRYLQHSLWELPITTEALTVGIFNASGLPNVASTIARKLENIGVRVTEISNWQEEVAGTCEIRARDTDVESYTVKRLASLFDCSVTEGDVVARFDVMLIATSIL